MPYSSPIAPFASIARRNVSAYKRLYWQIRLYAIGKVKMSELSHFRAVKQAEQIASELPSHIVEKIELSVDRCFEVMPENEKKSSSISLATGA